MSRCRAALLSLLTLILAPTAIRAQWTPPTPDELKMTSVAEVPDAPAVVLYREELTDDDNHMRSRYFRIKVLTDAGKKYGDVQIQFDRRSDGNGYSVSEIAGRTIQPDGTIVPFSGKPYDKVLEKDKTNQYTAKVFSMPAVQVGSILEYRYKLRWEDNIFWSPEWDIQTDLLLRRGHFVWKPTDKELLHSSRGHESTTSLLTWHSALPPGVKVVNTLLPNQRRIFTVDINDVLPLGVEEYMPPVLTAMYHVYFYYSPYRTPQEFWSTEGKYWSGEANKFMGNSSFVRDTANAAVAGVASDDEKAQKLYSLTSTLENTDYTRKRNLTEEQRLGLKETRSAEDVLRKKRGSSDQIAMTYVALARAAGLNSSLMIVTDRTYRITDLNWLNFRQLSDELAVVNTGGKEHFLDPGTPCTPYDHLDWTHSSSGGIRQQGKDTEIKTTPPETYKYSRTTRIADVKLDETGSMSGTVNMTFQGSPAVKLRQIAFRSDEAELREDLKKRLEAMMPGGSEVEVRTLEGLKDPNAVLKVSFQVKGNMGRAVGSRVVLPVDLFVADRPPAFPHEKRDQAVYFQYPEMTQDATRITFPSSFSVESAPAEERVPLKDVAAYAIRSKISGNSVTVWRDFSMGEFYFPLADFPNLRTFYATLERKDHSSVVLKRAASEKAEVQSPAKGR